MVAALSFINFGMVLAFVLVYSVAVYSKVTSFHYVFFVVYRKGLGMAGCYEWLLARVQRNVPFGTPKRTAG